MRALSALTNLFLVIVLATPSHTAVLPQQPQYPVSSSPPPYPVDRTLYCAKVAFRAGPAPHTVAVLATKSRSGNAAPFAWVEARKLCQFCAGTIEEIGGVGTGVNEGEIGLVCKKPGFPLD